MSEDINRPRRRFLGIAAALALNQLGSASAESNKTKPAVDPEAVRYSLL